MTDVFAETAGPIDTFKPTITADPFGDTAGPSVKELVDPFADSAGPPAEQPQAISPNDAFGESAGGAQLESQDSNFNWVGRSYNRAKRDMYAGGGASGIIDPATAAMGMAEAEREAQQYKYSPDVEEAFRNFPVDGTMGEGLSWMVNNPKASAVMFGDNAANVAISTGAAFAGAGIGGFFGSAPGAAVGLVGGAFAGSALPDYASTITQSMQDAGVDITSQEQIESALTNKDVMAKANKQALLHGVSVGAIDAFTSLLGVKGVGGKVVSSFLPRLAEGQIAKETLGKTLAEIGVNTGIDAVGGGLGEGIGSQLAYGQVKWAQLVPEMLFEVPGGAVEASLETYVAHANKSDQASDEDIANAAGVPQGEVRMPTAEEAATDQGRTLFGYDEGNGKPVQLHEDYNEAEKAMGAGPAQRGRLIAVKPEDTVEAREGLELQKAPNYYPTDETGVYTTKVVEDEPPVKLALKNPLVVDKSYNFSQTQVDKLRTLGYDGIVDTKNGTATVFNPAQVKDLTSQVLGSAKRTFAGDSARHEVMPNVQNPMGLGEVRIKDGMAMGTGVTDSGVDYDATKLFGSMKGKIYIPAASIQHAIKRIGLDAVKQMVKVNDPNIEDAVFSGINFDLDEYKAAVVDGRIEFAPDSRVLGDVSSFVEFQNTTDDEIKAAFEAAKITLPKGIKQLKDLGQTRATRTYPADVQGYASAPDIQWATQFPPGVTFVRSAVESQMQKAISNLVEKMANILWKQFGLDGHLIVSLLDHRIDPTYPKWFQSLVNPKQGAGGTYMQITDNVSYIVVTPAEGLRRAFTIFAHEFGHLIAGARFRKASVETRTKIYAAYRRFIAQMPARGNIPLKTSERRGAAGEYSQFNRNEDLKYYLTFDEWFAEQVGRYGTTNRGVLGAVGRFFKSVVKDLLAALRTAREQTNYEEDFRAEPEIEAWLNSMRQGITVSKWAGVAKAAFDKETVKRNAPYVDNTPRQPQTTQIAQVLSHHVASGAINPSTAAQITAYQDKFNIFYQWGLTLRQIAMRNPMLRPIHAYIEWLDAAKLDKNKLMMRTDKILADWRNLPGRDQGNKLGEFLFQLTNMTYRTPAEVAAGVRRWPTPAEFSAIARQLNLSRQTLQLYIRIRDSFTDGVQKQYELALVQAMKITNPVSQRTAVNAANLRRLQLLKAPYFPFTRFGDWVVIVKGPQGHVEHREHFDTKKQRGEAYDAAMIQYPASAGFEVYTDTVPKEVRPYVNMPPWLVDKIMGLPGMTKPQLDWLQNLRYDIAPQKSFVKHLIKRHSIAGYSLDARRVYAEYMFHFANNYARLKYSENAEMEISKLETPEMKRDAKRRDIASSMREHWNEFVNPSKDWALLRSATAVWHLAFVPAAAMMNLSQVPLITMPFLADKFGDVKSIAYLTNAITEMKNYYRQGNIPNNIGKWKALGEAIDRGIIDESQAAELASMTGGSRSAIGQKAKELWNKTTAGGMFMFKMAEQWNRRMTFRAAYDLAYDHPNAKWFSELRVARTQLYNELTTLKNWSDREAMAFIAAEQAVLQTQYAYDHLERPRFMRGRKAAFLAFYSFTQQTLFTLWNNPGLAMRYTLMMAVLAGPMGLVPDDIEDILNFIGRQAFGGTFNLERQAREFMVDQFGEKPAGDETYDMILHGASREGFGIPWVMQQAGVDFMPNIDRSQSITLNRVLPLGGVTSILNPGADWNQKLAEATSNAAGAAFGPMLSVANALVGSDLALTDMKRWERAFPRAMRRVTEAARLAYTGQETTNRGVPTMLYDRQDPQEMAELIAIAMGYTTTRKSRFYDRREAMYEIDSFWDIRRQLQLDNAFTAKQDGAVGEWDEALKAIRVFNEQVRAIDPKKMITKDTIKRSFEAKLKIRKQMEQNGQPAGVSDATVDQVNRLYPESIVQERKVR